MADATRLTRAGDLHAATAAIQAALARGTFTPHPTPTPTPTRTSTRADADVIDMPGRAIDAGESFTAGRFVHRAGTREYKVFAPGNLGGEARPMVVMLHGCTQNPDDFAAGTRMNEAARAHGFVVLYPAQAQGANPSRCWNWFKHNHQQRERGEPSLIADLTREVARRHGVDARRIYVAGLSAGGAMAAILGETHPDLYAAVGVHSGLPPGAASNAQTAFEAMKRGAASRPGVDRPRAPTIVFHGDRDSTVHPINGAQLVAALVAGLAGATAPPAQPTRGTNGREFTRQVFRAADGRVLAEHWVVHGGGHAWSGGSALGSYTDALGPDATAEMLRFFAEHTLPA